MSPSKKRSKKKDNGPRDPRNSRAVFSTGTAPLKSNPLPSAPHRINNNNNNNNNIMSSSSRRSSSSTRATTSAARGSRSSGEIYDLAFSSDDDEDPRVQDENFALDPRRVVSTITRGAELHDDEMEAVLMTSAIAHMLNRNSNATGLCFTTQELEGWMGALVDNRDAIITLAIQADGRAGPGEPTFAARMRAAIPERFSKRNRYKNLLANGLAEVYSVYTALARVVERLPPPRSNHGKALSNLVTNLARVHALCAKEMQEEQEKEKYMKSEKITGKRYYRLCLSFVIFLSYILSYH